MQHAHVDIQSLGKDIKKVSIIKMSARGEKEKTPVERGKMTVMLNNSSSWQIQTGTVKSPLGTVWGQFFRRVS